MTRGLAKSAARLRTDVWPSDSQQPVPDGGVEQQNFRLSRSLRPNIDEHSVGLLSVEIVEPYEHIRLRWEAGEFPVSFDINWRKFLPPSEERPHFRRLNGRPFEDYIRYTQSGRASGSITLGDRRLDINDWWAGRDHSWGVRSQVGGYEPLNGPGTEEMLSRSGLRLLLTHLQYGRLRRLYRPAVPGRWHVHLHRW